MKFHVLRAVLLATAGLVAAGVTGCAEERPAINRVQANALAKSFFVGPSLQDIADDPEFYMRGTVVDVGYGAAQDGLFTSTYAQPVARIKWEITENVLNARLAYERIEGSDGKGNTYDGLTPKTTNDGQIVASYTIVSHFDIRREYNPTTGEESNVIVENTTDRPWNEREYMRVDWSRNLATSAYTYDTLSQLGLFGGVEYEPLAYYVNDPHDADAPHFDPDQGYFDITTKAFAKPELLDLSSLGWGIDTFPACMLPGEFAGGTDPYGDCNPVEITVRNSFKRVKDTDYEPVSSDGVRFQAFGGFNFDYRYGYDRNYGMVDNQWRRFAARYNIWKRSHYYTNPDAMTGEIAWLDMMRIYRLGTNADPAFGQRIEWQDPTSGQIYYARTYGMECLFGTGDDRTACEATGGRWVQRGIAARVLEYANSLTGRGYQIDTSVAAQPGDPAYVAEYGAGFNGYGRAIVMHHPDGTAIIVPDPAIKDVPPTGPLQDVPPCDQNVDPTCTQLTIYKNHYAYELKSYKSVPDYLLQMMADYGLADPDQLGVFPD